MIAEPFRLKIQNHEGRQMEKWMLGRQAGDITTHDSLLYMKVSYQRAGESAYSFIQAELWGPYDAVRVFIK